MRSQTQDVECLEVGEDKASMEDMQQATALTGMFA